MEKKKCSIVHCLKQLCKHCILAYFALSLNCSLPYSAASRWSPFPFPSHLISFLCVRGIELKQEGCDIAGGFVFFQTGLGRSSLKRSVSKEKFITCGSIR